MLLYLKSTIQCYQILIGHSQYKYVHCSTTPCTPIQHRRVESILPMSRNVPHVEFPLSRAERSRVFIDFCFRGRRTLGEILCADDARFLRQTDIPLCLRGAVVEYDTNTPNRVEVQSNGTSRRAVRRIRSVGRADWRRRKQCYGKRGLQRGWQGQSKWI